jgi:hypothetical protein
MIDNVRLPILDVKRVIEETEYAGYAERVAKLDDILDRLGTKRYCAIECSCSPVGCCDYNAHFAFNEEFRELQELEALGNGWNPDSYKTHDKTGCKFHSLESGCYLGSLKSDLCVGSLCTELEIHLKNQYGDNPVTRQFIRRAELVFCAIGGESVYNRLDAAIFAGEALLENA